MLNIADSRQREAGFTLVEIMAVVLLIGTMIGLVAISVGGKAERELELESQKLYQKLRLLMELAELDGVEVGFMRTDDGYQFLLFDDASLEWKTMDERQLAPVTTNRSYQFLLDRDREELDTKVLYETGRREKARDYGENAYNEPELMFFSDGQLTSFSLTVVNKNIPKLSYVITGKSPASLNIKRHDK